MKFRATACRLLLAIVCMIGCARPGATVEQRVSAGTAAARMISVAPDASLEILDWGGSGPPLVFLSGLGNSAHVFDDFAPQFTDSFHVLGITRRGFGASTGVPAAKLDSLAGDLRAVIDSLHLASVVLVGHSIAGEEMTRFAESNPARCAGLVYLDAAYDRTDPRALNPPSVSGPRVRSSDTRTFASIKALHVRALGVREPDSELRATAHFDANDRYHGEVAADSVKARVFAAAQAPHYDRVKCNSLAIYAMPDSVGDVLPYHAELEASVRPKSDSLLMFVRTLVERSAADFARFPHHRAIMIHGNHFIFLARPAEVASAMRDFLDVSRRRNADRR